MNMELIKSYRAERALGFQARWALSNARTRLEWDELSGHEVDYGYNPEPDESPVRLRVEPDDSPDLSFLDQDNFADVREREYERANRDGVWGLIGEFWDGREWQHADSVWDFIGDDWRNSGYDTDVMRATIDAYRAQLDLGV